MISKLEACIPFASTHKPILLKRPLRFKRTHFPNGRQANEYDITLHN